MDSKGIALKALIQASMYGLVVLLILLLLQAAQVLLLVFAGILLATLFRGLTDWLVKKTGMPEKVALALSIVVPIILLGIAIWFKAADISSQASQLADRLPQAIGTLKQRLLQYSWIEQAWNNKQKLQQMIPRQSSGINMVTSFFSSTFGMFGNLVIILFIGLFLSINPHLYIDGAVRLFPINRRDRARAILVATGCTLQSWLAAKLIDMAVLGTLTALGLWVLDIDLALVLGVIAALLSFIPNFGPILSVIPAALIALVVGPEKALYVLLLYAGIQTFESYVLTPLLQRHAVDLPPALLIAMQVLLGVLASILGLVVATPLTAAGMVIVKKWYVEDLLEGNHQ